MGLRAAASAVLGAFWIALLPPASAGEQADHALAAIRQLQSSGEIKRGTVLRVAFKQGNINAFLGRSLEMQKEWERQTGVVIEARIIPQRPAQVTLRETGGIDLTVARNHEFPELLPLGLIEDLTPLFKEFGFGLPADRKTGFIRPELQSYLGERIVAVPADGDLVMLYLRRDLLEDPAEQAAFRKATGRALAPPTTWDEYTELVRFFHRPEKGLYGAAEERDPDGAWMYWLPRFLSMAEPFQALFDQRMRPLINTPAGIAATESYVSLVKYSPPGITDAGKDYSFTIPLFMQGKVFAITNTIAAAKLFNDENSAVRGKFMAVPLPGQRIGKHVVQRNTIIYGNNLVIPKGSANRKLAFLYSMWLTDPDISTRSVGIPGGFADPYRWNHLQDARIREVYTPGALAVFAQQWAVTLPPGTGIPGDSEYLAALDRQLTAAARGEVTAREAMARAAAEWEKITERLGRAEQTQHWLSFRKGFVVQKAAVDSGPSQAGERRN